MPPVDAHTVVDHRVLDFIDDSRPGSFDAQSFFYLQRARMSRSSHLRDATLLLYVLLCPTGSQQVPPPFPKLDL